MNPCLTLITVLILLTLSKVFERLALYQLIVYINEEALLGPTVLGFRKGHLTTTCFTGDPRRSNAGIKQRKGDTDGLRRL